MEDTIKEGTIKTNNYTIIWEPLKLGDVIYEWPLRDDP